jgi:Xaa-Pro aminopeptidase
VTVTRTIPEPDTSAPESELVAEKVEQAASALDDRGLDCWLTVARETTAVPDPSLPLLLDFDVVWTTAVLVFRDGSSHVVLGRHDGPNARELGVHEVHTYDESIRDSLLSALQSGDPDRIAVNYSADDPMADGLSHGLYCRLRELLAGTDYEDSLVSGAELVGEVRGRKSPAELGRIAAATEETQTLLRSVGDVWDPAWTERDVSEYLHGETDDRGYGYAWSEDYCPTVHAGGAAPVGHTKPGDRTVPEGELLHLDFGVTVAGYAADVQRVYVRGDAGAALESDFADVRGAIEAGRDALEPGVPGYEVDAAAREELTDRGHDAFAHALGHQVGRHAHDGATLLGPRWERYGSAPEREVAAGEVYTVELGVETDAGYLGQEEMVLVTDDGAEYLTDPQTDLWAL